MRLLVDSFVLFYEPRRGGTAPESSAGGRSAFIGGAFVDQLTDDPTQLDHAYAHFRYAVDFNTAVPISATSISGKALQSAVIDVPYGEAERIVGLGLSVDTGKDSFGARQGLVDVDELTHLTDRPLQEVTLNRRVRDQSFRYRVVEQVYGGTCALTGIRMTNGHGRAEADAAHIVPVEKNGPDTVRNGIALMKSVHWAFDRGLVALSDEGRILTMQRGLDNSLRRLLTEDGMARLPRRLDERPHPAFLAWHRENVFKGAR